jgi:hypothetical protein
MILSPWVKKAVVENGKYVNSHIAPSVVLLKFAIHRV